MLFSRDEHALIVTPWEPAQRCISSAADRHPVGTCSSAASAVLQIVTPWELAQRCVSCAAGWHRVGTHVLISLK